MNLSSTAQAGQDVFAYEVTGRRKDGTFLDIGAFNLCICNNTYSLEKIGWKGLLVDLFKDEENVTRRNSPFLQADATKLDWPAVIATTGLGPRITYGSFDIDDATADLIDVFPFELFSFDVLTVEHDFYRVGPEKQKRIRERLGTLGYVTICADVKISIPGYNIDGPFEDWLVAPPLAATAQRFNCSSQYWPVILRGLV